MNLLTCFFVSAVFLTVQGYTPTSLYCYQCVSTHPGCGEPFNWRWYLGQAWANPCPERNDKCVKVIERKGGEELITRACLSSLFHRTDIPADHYEGCRPAAKDVHLSNYVNNTIKELDTARDFYDATTFCFCHFDNRCNSSAAISAAPVVLAMAWLLSKFYSTLM